MVFSAYDQQQAFVLLFSFKVKNYIISEHGMFTIQDWCVNPNA